MPEELQDETWHYCTKCEAKYTARDELNRHVTKNCQVKGPDFFCDQCDASFFWPNTIREHYYKEHIKKYLYHCRKCGKGFHWKSRIPHHNKKCSMKNGPNKYEGKLPYDEKVEEKFKRKKAVPFEIPEDLIPNEEQELPIAPVQQQQQQDVLVPSNELPVQSSATPQLAGEEDPTLQDVKHPLAPVLQTPSIGPSAPVEETTSTDPSNPVEQIPSTDPSAPVQPLSFGGNESTTDDVLDMISQGRIPNIASEIQGVEEEEEGEDEDKKPILIDVENKFEQ